MPESFVSRFAKASSRFGPLVWGLDPSERVLEEWGLGDSPDGLDHFADVVLEAALDTVGLVKPQAAFYERHGWRGVRTLQRLTHDARDAGLLVIVDAKRGDVGSTNDAYAHAYLGAGAPLAADALTVHPYLGLGAMGAFVQRADAAGALLLVVTRSSNPEGRAIQAASTSGGTVEESLLEEIGALNHRLRPDVTDPIGPVGAVIAPSTTEPPLDLVSANALFLAPGIGAQGATPADVAQVFAACRDRVMPAASRSILAAGPDRNRMKDEAASLGAEFGELLRPS
jgi:orotidine-5'-phosphate decarboxylase